MAATAKTDWFWSDWSADPAVRRLSPAERGVWIDLLALASAGKPTGYVTDRKGRPIPLDEIARFTNCPIQELPKLIDAIEEKGAASRDRAGRLFNRRMVREAALSAKRAASGRLGADATNKKRKGNPDLPRQTARQNLERRGSLDPPGSQTIDEDTSAARASKPPLISASAFELSGQVCTAIGWDLDDPRCVGAPWEVQRWLNQGWSGELCVATAKRVATGRQVRNLKYFEGAIADAHANFAKPLPVAKPHAENVHVLHRSGSTSGARLGFSGLALQRAARAAAAKEHS